jgi:hypothetical protein
MSSTCNYPPRAAMAMEAASPVVTDEDWKRFVEEISRRLKTEEELTFLHAVLGKVFHFEGEFFPVLQERARANRIPFAFAGFHWRSNGEPAVIVFTRRE